MSRVFLRSPVVEMSPLIIIDKQTDDLRCHSEEPHPTAEGQVTVSIQTSLDPSLGAHLKKLEHTTDKQVEKSARSPCRARTSTQGKCRVGLMERTEVLVLLTVIFKGDKTRGITPERFLSR